MKSLKISLLLVGTLGLLLLGACQKTSTSSSSTISPTTSVSPATKTASSSQPQKGGQVVESGAYHLEFVPEPGEEGTHLDLYLQKGDNHEAIPNAKVTAQVQLPDGTQKTLNLPYDAEGKHYAALFPGKASGQYQVKITADIQGEKADGRFNFTR
ncbi:MAG: hypothetical protein KME17_23475 [Cyanosarcina radialis HA8281-LM2]|jgi:hypothetical protein|nr:hypothetical protein [Cyanosarcina radialis HA8281-LM2]